LGSCSFFSTFSSRRPVQDYAQEGQKGNLEGSPREQLVYVQTVPKSQYDELLKKYETLLQQYEGKASAAVEEKEGTHQPQEDGKRAGAHQLDVETIGLAEELKKALTETDAAGNTTTKGEEQYHSQNDGQTPTLPTVSIEQPPRPSLVPTTSSLHIGRHQMSEEMEKVQQARSLLGEKKYSEALPLLRHLEQSPSEQMRVRAVSLLGDLFYAQGEYDLAMQSYLEVVHKYSFSSYKISSLEKLVNCAQKLQLFDQAKKYSLLLEHFYPRSYKELSGEAPTKSLETKHHL
jgi:TolA-binding protein